MTDPTHIRVQSKGFDPFSIRVTDDEGNPITGVRSITWRCRYPGIPKFIVEGDGLNLDVGGELYASESEARLAEIREYLDRRIEHERANPWTGDEPPRMAPDLILRVYEELRAEFFGDAA